MFFCVFVLISLQLIGHEHDYGRNDRDVLIKALHAVSEDDISGWMHTMISPEMRGRLAGDVGYDKAADWAAGKLEKWGLEPFFPEKGYFQEFDQPIRSSKTKESWLCMSQWAMTKL